MFKSVGGVIKSQMHRLGYKHRSSDDQFSIRGQYARNLQYVYSKEFKTNRGLIVDLIYFSVDIHSERLVIGFYRENTDDENNVLVNASRSLLLRDFNEENLFIELERLIPRVWRGN